MRWLIARILFLPTLAWNVLLGRLLKARRWWDRVDEHVLLGALPFAGDVPALQAAGIRAVVNMCEEYAGPVAAYERAGMVQLRLPTSDFVPPSLQAVEQGVDFICEHVARGEGVYVHCKAGRGRSATVVLCWLVAAKQLSAAQAQAKLLQVRPHVNRHLDQRQVVQAFCAARRQQHPGSASD